MFLGHSFQLHCFLLYNGLETLPCCAHLLCSFRSQAISSAYPVIGQWPFAFSARCAILKNIDRKMLVQFVFVICEYVCACLYMCVGCGSWRIMSCVCMFVYMCGWWVLAYHVMCVHICISVGGGSWRIMSCVCTFVYVCGWWVVAYHVMCVEDKCNLRHCSSLSSLCGTAFFCSLLHMPGWALGSLESSCLHCWFLPTHVSL